MSSSPTVIVLDNGGGYIKLGIGGERDPTAIVPNSTARSTSFKKTLIADEITAVDPTSLTLRRPLDRGYLTNPDLQRDIWAHLFKTHLPSTPPDTSSLLLTQPPFSLSLSPSLRRPLFELVFEDFGFRSCFVSDSASLVHLYEASRNPDGVVSRSQCSMVVDCGFSFTHCTPVFQNFTLNYGVRRLDLGGKALTNYLKELVSYRSVNVMDETLLIDHVKEKLCFVSTDVPRDLQIARKSGKDNLFKCTYVLPDGITHTKGFVKDVNEAERYRSVYDGVPDFPMNEKEDMDVDEDEEMSNGRKKIDLSKNEINLTNERFLVPEMIFRPADLGMNEAGLAECIVRSVNACHPLLHPVLYESIILTGGSTLFPHFAKRLEQELRPLVPDDYQVKITTQEDPILGVWRGGSLLASSPDFETMCATKFEYEEEGSARCSRRFFQ
ncbi:actin-related protein 6 [Silene latifolia]|uniref:actin-related protein 6 n=1 Tax=Silene latifolia TaxID=37657 RepID=UPI003D78999E